MKTLSNALTAMMCLTLLLGNLSCTEEAIEDVIEAETLKTDFKFITGEMICPPHSNYQIGWNATAKNVGETSGKIVVQAWLSHDAVLGDDAAAGGLVFGDADANESLTETFGATVENVADYSFLILQIDHDNLVEETDETNNLLVIAIPEDYSGSFCNPEVAKPDLEFLAGAVICPPQANYQIGWEADVKNSGTAAAEATVQAWLSHDQILGDDAAAGGLVFGDVDPDESISKTFGATVSNVEDYKYLLLQIDHNELVDESDETNNVMVIEIPEEYSGSFCNPDVAKADFAFLSGKITCPPHSNYQIGWQADVTNIGDLAGQASVQAWLSHDENLGDDAPAGGLVFGTIAPNGNIADDFGATVSNVGDYKYLLLQIDHNALVDESDETNNILVIEIPENYPYALCQPEDFDAITCGDINFNESNLTSDVIVASDDSGNIFQEGDVIIYRTNENRCGKLEIVAIEDAANKRLTIKAVTFNNDGSIYAQTNSLQIRGTWSCDLDEMVEPAAGITAERDFFWRRRTATTTHFTPQNGATFYKYEF